MIKADLHIHSSHSPDSGMSPDAIIRTCLRRGIGCIAITDHNTIGGVRELQSLAPFPVIAGEEIRTTHGEVMGLFLQEEIPRGLSPGRAVEEIRAQGGVVCVPHPFDRLRKSALDTAALLEIVEMVDIIETHNSRITFIQDQSTAELFAQQHGKLRGGGSDAHVWWEIGHSYVEMPEFSGPKEFLASMARATVHGKLSSPIVHLGSAFARWRKRK